MNRFYISLFSCGLAFALLFNPNAIAQSGGSFSLAKTTQLPGNPPASSIPGSSNSQFATPKSTTTLSQPKLKPFLPNSFSGGGSLSKPVSGTASPTKPPAQSMGFGSAKPSTFGSPASFPAQGRPSFGANSIGSTQLTSSKSSGGSTNHPPDSVDCPISSVHFIEDIQLPALEAGEIKLMNFKEGDFVPAGQIIAQINDENYQMLLEQADMRYQIALDAAGDSTASLAAKKKHQVASIEAKKTNRLAESGSKSASDKMMANYTAEIALLEWQKAEQERRKALAEAKLALAEKRQVQKKIDRHTLRPDFDAYVVEIMKHKQEYVQVGEEVMRLARMDRVWVQSVVDTKELNAHELMNRKVTVTIELARNETAKFEGRVKFVGLERQGPELLMVKAEVANRPINGHWILHPEAEVSMKIHLNDDTSSSSFGSASTPSTPNVNR